MQRRWQRSPDPAAHDGGGDEGGLDRLLSTQVVPIPSGSTPVRSLTGRFDGTNGHQNGGRQNGSNTEEALELRAVVADQRRQIEGLRREAAGKDKRIRELEDRVKTLMDEK